MRRQIAPSLIRYVLIALAFVLVGRTHAFADDRADARTHYQAGVKYYNGGDYRSAIREFSAAQQLLPADLNNYNLALCYDKLGDPEPAVQYYRAYLDKVPSTDKRAEIEASVARLDAAAKSVAQKKADELRRIDEAKRAEEERKQYEETKRAETARKAEEARAAAEARKRPPVEEGGDVAPPVGVGSTGVPSTGTVAGTTGDAQLDRVQGMSIDQIRDQRVGAAGSGMVDPNRGPAVGANGGMAPPPTGNGAPPVAGVAPPVNGQQPMGPQDQPKKADPVYKKWWFWAVVVVSAYVVYEIAIADSSSSSTGRTMLPIGPAAAQPSGGYTLMRW